MSKVIFARENGGNRPPKERTASEALTPGHLLQILSTGKVQKNDVVGRKIPVAVACADTLQGNGVDVAYAADDLVTYRCAIPGDEIHVILNDGASVSIGDPLKPVAGGEVGQWVNDSSSGDVDTQAQFIALEALDLEQESSSDVAESIPNRRLLVEVI